MRSQCLKRLLHGTKILSEPLLVFTALLFDPTWRFPIQQGFGLQKPVSPSLRPTTLRIQSKDEVVLNNNGLKPNLPAGQAQSISVPPHPPIIPKPRRIQAPRQHRNPDAPVLTSSAYKALKQGHLIHVSTGSSGPQY
mmetsp:Transcript_17806/g.44890  ORF Transcript_17806/g.44890 Transcript_17806/m.44890 type:complete len:137 (-) Transcript_17806:1753-2163(-)